MSHDALFISPMTLRYMPPTTPVGIPCIAIIFARAIINGEDRGVRPFVVPIHDGRDMNPGVVSKCVAPTIFIILGTISHYCFLRLLPPRGGSRPLNHSLTYFHHVQLPYSAMLGSPDKPADARLSFFTNISRVAVGTIAIGSLPLPALRVSSYIGARYSLRRMVLDNENTQRPIISFRTQKIPVLTSLAQAYVMEAMHGYATSLFSDASLDMRIRHAIAAIFKVTNTRHALEGSLTLGDRCGAQGLFEANQLAALFVRLSVRCALQRQMLTPGLSGGYSRDINRRR